jgi:hypothetical protein
VILSSPTTLADRNNSVTTILLCCKPWSERVDRRPQIAPEEQ